jgi:hypothetical protein
MGRHDLIMWTSSHTYVNMCMFYLSSASLIYVSIGLYQLLLVLSLISLVE